MWVRVLQVSTNSIAINCITNKLGYFISVLDTNAWLGILDNKCLEIFSLRIWYETLSCFAAHSSSFAAPSTESMSTINTIYACVLHNTTKNGPCNMTLPNINTILCIFTNWHSIAKYNQNYYKSRCNGISDLWIAEEAT